MSYEPSYTPGAAAPGEPMGRFLELRAAVDRGRAAGRPTPDDVVDELLRLRQAWADDEAADPLAYRVFGSLHSAPSLELIVAEYGPGSGAFTASASARAAPRHRLADAFPIATWEHIDDRLAERARDPALSLQAIADELTDANGLRFTLSRIRRIEQTRNAVLTATGMDLPALFRSREDFWTTGDAYRLPGTAKVCELLGIPPPKS